MFPSINTKRALVMRPALNKVMEVEVKLNTQSPTLVVLMDYWEEGSLNQRII